MFKEISTVVMAAIIALLVIVIVGLLIHAKGLNDTIANNALTYAAEIVKANEQKEVLEEQIRTLIDNSNQVVIEGEQREKVRVEYVTKEIDKVIFTPTYSNICLDNWGLLNINRLITESDDYSGAASEPAPAL